MTSENIALAVVGKIVEKAVDPIVNTVVRQFSYIFCYKQNIQTLVEKLALLEARRDGVQQSKAEAERNLETVDPTITLWLANVDDIKSKAMEVLEGTSNVKKGCLNGWYPNLKHRYLLSRKATKLTAGIGKLQAKGDKDAKFAHSAPPIGIISTTEVASISPKDDTVKGFATRIANMNEVMDALKDDGVNLIGISGMGGVGKTTLVNQVLEKVKAERLFNEFALTVVSQNPDLVKIQSEIGGMLGLEFKDGPIAARAKRLSERLEKEGRVLIVLDDVWEGINLGEVGIPAGNGCKVVFTTRVERACIEMAAQRHVIVRVLSDQEAWDLFRDAAGDCIENADVRNFAEEVAKECGGLPIALVTLGKALSKRDKYEWEDTLLQLKKSSGVEEKVKKSIMQSYEFLESRRPNPQPLLLLCSLFEEDENIRLEQLTIYSIGLELFDDVETLEETRNRVHTLVKYLKSCNLLLQGDGDDDLCVKLHDVVRDVCLIIASSLQHDYLVRHDLKLKQWPRHNKQKSPTAIALKSEELNELPGGLDYPNLRLLQLKLNHENINIADDFFQGMRGLQVFNFDGQLDYRLGKVPRCNVILPPTLKLLTNLQALSLEFCNWVGNISSIGCLKGLKILSLFESKLDEFPCEVLNELKNLKLLDLRWKYCNHRNGSFVLSGMDQLEVLYMGNYASWAENGTSITELNSLPSLTTLQLVVWKSMILLKLEESFFERLKRFDISIGLGWYGKYVIMRNSISQEDDLSLLSYTKLHLLVRKTKYLKLKRCTDERSLIDEAESAHYAFHDVETLEIMDMYDLTGISKIPDGSFQKLQELRLIFLPALRHLWSGPIQPPSLGNLRDIEINTCNSIEYLFLPSVAKCLVQLETLNVNFCDELKGVIFYDGRDGSEEFEMIQFPKLNYLRLWSLQTLKSFCQEPGNEDLEGDCGTVQIMFNQRVSFPSLDKLVIHYLSTLKKIVGSQMQDGPANKLRIIEVSKCENLKNFVDSPTLQNLEDVDISWCESMEVVFDLKGLKVAEGNAPFIFDKLTDITLRYMPGLTHVWKMPPENIQGFRNLTTFEAVYCNELGYLLTDSMAKMLVNLQVLKVKGCSKIVVIIEGDDEGCSSETRSKDSIVFPQLKVLHLEELKSFTSFCSSKYSFEFPLLDEVRIECCPNMKTFCSGVVNAPMLKEPVSVEKHWIWEDNLNNGIYKASDVKTLNIVDMDDLTELSKDGSFQKLEVLRLRRLPALRHLWSGPIQPPSLGNLRDIDINTCHSIEYLFSPSVAKCLVHLEMLNIECCSELKGVISYDGRDGSEEFEMIQFPKLNYLKLNSLETLESFCQEPGNEDLEGDCGTVKSLLNQRVGFPNLDKMEIYQLSTLKKIVGSQMQDGPANKHRIIEVSKCDNLKNFVDSPTLQNLEYVDISWCESMEVVFDLKGLKVAEGNAPFIFDKLTDITLRYMPGLTHVWKMPPEYIQGFRNLTTFKADYCHELRYLLTDSMAKMLVSLQVLIVEYCSNIVVIIEGGDEGCSSEPRSKDSIVFPQLQALYLVESDSFTSFCSSQYSFEFPLLDEVEICRCPNMKTFCSGVVNAPVLKEPVSEEDHWIWEDNLNNGFYKECDMNEKDEDEEFEDESESKGREESGDADNIDLDFLNFST